MMFYHWFIYSLLRRQRMWTRLRKL